MQRGRRPRLGERAAPYGPGWGQRGDQYDRDHGGFAGEHTQSQEQRQQPPSSGSHYLGGQHFMPEDQWRRQQQQQQQSQFSGSLPEPHGRRRISQSSGASVDSTWMAGGGVSGSGMFHPAGQGSVPVLPPPHINRDGAGLGGGAFGPAAAPLYVGGPYQGQRRIEASMVGSGGGSPRRSALPAVSSIPLQDVRDHQRQRAASSDELYGVQSFRPVLPTTPTPTPGDRTQEIILCREVQSQPLPPHLGQHPLGSISSYVPSHSPGRSPGRSLQSYPRRSPSLSLSQGSPSRDGRPRSEASYASARTVSSQDSGSSSGRQQKTGSKRGGGKKRTRKTPSPSVMHGEAMGDDGRSTPLPQNLRGDPFRSAKVKTELCRNFMSGKVCQFGDKCNYAHGEHELKYTKLLHLENAGLVDVEIFRTRPCITWMATGACPFDQRCLGLHDPRVSGSHPSWLPHAETLLNGIMSNRNVDKTYHQQLASVYSCSPLYGYIPDRKWQSEEANTLSAWKHFYNYVCNLTGQSNVLSPPEVCRVYVALKMRERMSAKCYAYRPTHLLKGELCMVLQTKTFVIPGDVSTMCSEDIMDVTGETTYTTDPTRTLGKDLITANEIAFGPVGDPSVRHVSVWFNLAKDDLVECTQQQAKRHKRSRHRIKRAEERGKAKALVSAETCRRERAASLLQDSGDDPDDTEARPFYNYQPMDTATFDLATDILRHRLHFLDSIAVMPQDPETKGRILDERLQNEENRLKSRFESLRRHWMTWSWPVKCGVVQIVESTDVPPVDGTYAFDMDEPDNFQVESFFGINDGEGTDITSRQAKMTVGFLWVSFLINIQIISGKIPVLENDASLAKVYDTYCQLHRLPVMRYLSMGSTISANRWIPTLSSLSSSHRMDNFKGWNDFFKVWEELDEYYDKTQSSPLRSSQGAEGGDKSSDASSRTAHDINNILKVAANSEMRLRL
mmetsp:Transcript_25441/g.55581  ORF Transcript_25441/g.55581 Transcript_25441/m.55581 type:complete len:955 (-) Transcript_25441:277-3141(-)